MRPGRHPARWWAASRRRVGGFERWAQAGARGCRGQLGPADPLHPPAQLPLTADALTFAEVSKDPKGQEWLWSPQIVGLYNRLLQRCELNRHTTEAAAGALQNITAGDRRVRGTREAQAREPALQECTVCQGRDGETNATARMSQNIGVRGRKAGRESRGRLRGSEERRSGSQAGQASGCGSSSAGARGGAGRCERRRRGACAGADAQGRVPPQLSRQGPCGCRARGLLPTPPSPPPCSGRAC